MPYARRRTRKASRKSYVRQTRGRKAFRPRRARITKAVSFRSKWKNPLPGKGYYKLRYNDTGFSVTTADVIWQVGHTFRGNSLYDPDESGVGVQPYGYDQLCSAASPFGKYTVFASKIKIYPHYTDTDTLPRGVRWIVVPSRSVQPAYFEFEDLKQMPGARSLVINDIGDQKGHLSSYMSTRRIFSDLPSLSNDTSSNYNGNPASTWYWYIQTDSQSQAVQIDQMFDVAITYYCVLSKIESVNES